MNEIRYEIIITFLENADKLKKTVQSCKNQILENDRIIIVGTGNLEQIKSLKEIKKYKKQITFKQTATVADAYNECVRESESQYTIFMKEGDWLGEGFLKHAASVMEDEKEQQIEEPEAESESQIESEDEHEEEHKTKGVVLQNEIMNPGEVSVLLPVQYCDNLLVSEKPKKHILSKKVIKGTYGVDITKNYWALQTALPGAVIRTA